MLNFGQPEYLYLLIAVPFFFAVYGFMRYMRRRRIRKFGDPRLVDSLMPSFSVSRGWIRLALFTVAFIFFVLGISRPRIGARLKEKKVQGVEIMIALDVSNSMLAQDYKPNRLENAKFAISRLVDNMKDDRIGMVIFAGKSFVQLPITTDYVSAKMFLSSISTESIPVQGTALEDAIHTCIKCYGSESDKSRAIILISDGENHEGNAVEAAKLAASYGIRIYTIGVGSLTGEPIPMNGELLKDKDGNIVVTKLDEQTLQKIALAGNGMYVHAKPNNFGLNHILEDINSLEKDSFTTVAFDEYDEQYMYFFAVSLLFFVLEMLVGDRKSKRQFFKRIQG